PAGCPPPGRRRSHVPKRTSPRSAAPTRACTASVPGTARTPCRYPGADRPASGTPPPPRRCTCRCRQSAARTACPGWPAATNRLDAWYGTPRSWRRRLRSRTRTGQTVEPSAVHPPVGERVDGVPPRDRPHRVQLLSTGAHCGTVGGQVVRATAAAVVGVGAVHGGGELATFGGGHDATPSRAGSSPPPAQSPCRRSRPSLL